MKAETIIDYDEAYYRSEDNNFVGIIVMTDYRLMFKFRDESIQQKMNMSEEHFIIPFAHIQK